MTISDGEEFERRVLSIVASFTKMKPSKITVASTLGQDLRIDSLALVSLIVRLEEELGMEIDDEAMALNGLHTVADIVSTMKGKPA